MITFKRLLPGEIPWAEMDTFWDRIVFQTREWMDFIAQTQGAQPVVAEIRDDGTPVGYFSGLTVRRFGLKILGSPLRGWTTSYQGFNLVRGFPRHRALAALERFAFHELGCVHLEICDRYLTLEDGAGSQFHCQPYCSYESDLTPAPDEIFGAMESACRRCIRKAEKSGVRIEEAQDDHFAVEYHDQLCEVFAKHGKRPTYGLERVRSLIRSVGPSGNLLLLRARNPEGDCIATGIFPGCNQMAEFWGNASHKYGLHLRPNELLHWYAMRYWKDRGVKTYDWGGGGDYKEKYGCKAVSCPVFIKSRHPVLYRLRETARRAYKLKSVIAYRLRSLASFGSRGHRGALD